MQLLNNEYAAAGIMGWWVGESGLFPQRCEGDYVKSNNTYPKSDTITARIDAGKGTQDGKIGFAGTGVPISDSRYRATWYINGSRYGPGYGLAQWTGEGRKGRLWDAWQSPAWASESIASTRFQCYYCVEEMRTQYGTCYRAMLNATSVRQAMYDFGYWYETGENASWAEQIVNDRIGYGDRIYSMYTGTQPGEQPEPPIAPDPEPPAYEPGEPVPPWVFGPLLRKERQTNGKRFYKMRRTL